MAAKLAHQWAALRLIRWLIADARINWMSTKDRARTKLARAYPEPTKES
jgi:hypothetical protein